MTTQKDGMSPLFDGEAFYRIEVNGVIPENWRTRMAGMQIVTSDQERQDNKSVLQGFIKDQAELNGIFETLYRLQVIIVSVKQLNRK
jgi:hypothetical protein